MTKVQEKINEVSVANLSTEQQLIKITGFLTSQIQLRGEKSKKPYHYRYLGLLSKEKELYKGSL
ncbi:MAG: hypothetical protein NY202_01185 [Mollicutes bacterium UO1]